EPSPQPLPVVGCDVQTCPYPLEQPVVWHGVAFDERLGGRLGREPCMQLVPFDLKRDERRNDIVDVGRAGHMHRQRARAVVVPLTASRGRLHRLPILDAGAESLGEVLWQLTEKYPLDRADDRWQPVDRVDQRASVDVGAARARVEAGIHVAMRWLECAQVDLAGGA